MCLVMGSKNKQLKIACCLQKRKALLTALLYHVSVELLSAEGQYKIMPPYSRDVVSQRHTPALRLTGLCVGIFVFTHFARSEPFPLLCDVPEFQVVGSVQSAHNLQTENFCSFIHSFIHCVCTAVQGKVQVSHNVKESPYLFVFVSHPLLCLCRFQ